MKDAKQPSVTKQSTRRVGISLRCDPFPLFFHPELRQHEGEFLGILAQRAPAARFAGMARAHIGAQQQSRVAQARGAELGDPFGGLPLRSEENTAEIQSLSSN